MAEFEILPSPVRRTSKNVYAWGADGNWTPGITFATPGDLAVTPALARGLYSRSGAIVEVWFDYLVSGGLFTHTTASGELRITNLPFTARDEANANQQMVGTLQFEGITKASYTHYAVVSAENTNYMVVTASGSGQTWASVNAADMPTGGNPRLMGWLRYFTTGS